MKPVAAASTQKSTQLLPLRGELGSLSAGALLRVLASQTVSGTLYLSRAETGALMTLQRGEPRARTDFGAVDGTAFDLGATGAQFGFWPHTDMQVPTLPSRYPDLSGPLWALPALSEQSLLSTAETELYGLVARFTADAFTGALVLRGLDSGTSAWGVLLFQRGQLGGAVYGEGMRLRGGNAALRALVELRSALTRHALPGPVVAGLLGWLLGLQLSDTSSQGVPEGFSGLELTPIAARYHRAGSVYLELLRPAALPADPASLGLFAACQRAPSLALPSELHGWEGRRYGLTLRGRDALNPMTELAMRFGGDFGPSGRRTLEAFRRELSVQAASEALSLALDDLKVIVERLEAEGFVRLVSGVANGAAADHAAGNLSPTLRFQPR